MKRSEPPRHDQRDKEQKGESQQHGERKETFDEKLSPHGMRWIGPDAPGTIQGRLYFGERARCTEQQYGHARQPSPTVARSLGCGEDNPNLSGDLRAGILADVGLQSLFGERFI